MDRPESLAIVSIILSGVEALGSFMKPERAERDRLPNKELFYTFLRTYMPDWNKRTPTLEATVPEILGCIPVDEMRVISPLPNPRLFLFVLFMLCGQTSLTYANFTGPVVSVIEGDTIEVLHNTHPERVRLSGIDCPEKGQAFGDRAKQVASTLVFGKDVILQTHGQDKYGHTLGDVFLLDGTHVNHTLVKDGWCWWNRKDAPGDTVLKRLEQDAREARKGVWIDPTQVPPWEWRKRTR